MERLFEDLRVTMEIASDKQAEADLWRGKVSALMKTIHKKNRVPISAMTKAMGVSYRLLFYWLAGKGQPSVDIMKRMVKSLKKAKAA
jgi:hypothetical protein